MTMARWDPFGELVHARRMLDRLTEEPVRPVSLLHWDLDGGLAVDMYQTQDSVVVKASLPGIAPEDVDITVSGDTLTIKGEYKQEEVKREDYFFQERRFGAVSRTILLPSGLRTDDAEAVFDNGVVTITIPRAEHARKETIKVKAQVKQPRRVETRKT